MLIFIYDDIFEQFSRITLFPFRRENLTLQLKIEGKRGPTVEAEKRNSTRTWKFYFYYWKITFISFLIDSTQLLTFSHGQNPFGRIPILQADESMETR